MKAGSRQRWAAAGAAAEGQSLSARVCLLQRFRRPVLAVMLAGAACWTPLLSAAVPTSPAPNSLVPLHAAIAKPSAVHPAIPSAPAVPERTVPAPQQQLRQSLPASRPANIHPVDSPHPAQVNTGRIGQQSGLTPAAHAPYPYTERQLSPHSTLQGTTPYGTLQAQNNARQPFPPGQPPSRMNPPPGGEDRGEHLGSWMKQHQGQSLPEQERSLRQEPGFNRLEPQQQQNLVNHLHQLDQMPPQQRQLTLSRIENMEHLTPERRQAVRSSAQQLGALPEDRRRMVKKAFRDLRDLPPEQRLSIMNSPRFAGQFSAQERSIMGNLLIVEPYQRPGPDPQQPQNGR